MPKAKKVLAAVLVVLFTGTPLNPARPAAALPTPLTPSRAPLLAPLPPTLPITRTDWRTIYWVEKITKEIPWVRTITTRSPDITTTKLVGHRDKLSAGFFRYDALETLAYSTPSEKSKFRAALPDVVNAISDGVAEYKNRNYSPATFTAKVIIFGAADQRCTSANYDGTRSARKIDNTYDLSSTRYAPSKLGVDDYCTPLTPTTRDNLDWGPDGEVSTLMFGSGLPGRTRHITIGGGWLSLQRAFYLNQALNDEFRASSTAQKNMWFDFFKADTTTPLVYLRPMGEWNAISSVADCNSRVKGVNFQCALDRRAEVVVYVEWYTPDISITPGVVTTTIESGTDIVEETIPRSTLVNCTFYNTCLPAPPTVSATPTIQVPSFVQPNRTHSFSLTPVAFSSSGSSTPPTSGPAKSGWAAPQVLSATFSGFSASSITPPRGYTSPAFYEVKALPSGSANQGQALSVVFKKPTRAGESYTIRPGKVTITFSYTPWLWDGSKVSYFPDQAVTKTETLDVKCAYTPTGSSSCSFKVFGTANGS